MATSTLRRVAAGVAIGSAMLLGTVAPASASAAFTSISTPNAAYTSSTCLIDISGMANGSTTSSRTGCGTTLTFSGVMTKREVPGGGWNNWNSPPDAETATPHVLATGPAVTVLTINSSVPVLGIGVELGFDNFGTGNVTAQFRRSGGLQGSVTRSVTAPDGTRLFAARDSGGGFDQLRLTVPAAADGFAIAQLRVRASSGFTTTAVTVPERRPEGGGSLVPVTVTRASGTGSYTVNYTTLNGTAQAGKDYRKTSGTLTFAPGELSKTIEVLIIPDGVAEPEETFGVRLSNPSDGLLILPGLVLITITDFTT